ncbi:hypothetical protein FGO68_gene78 [Halteria grandinella]|uniref:Uncharacterized protein n=1 Tax=Halteria grandinella TaxID=5974 RepID=A0A8J8T2E5_HALGN|nr:hypothetical protein FGO68_gene78 [Halteria grandinella]
MQIIIQSIHDQPMNQLQHMLQCTVHPTEKVGCQCMEESCTNLHVQKPQYKEGCQDYKFTSVANLETKWKVILQKLSHFNSSLGMIIDQFNDAITVLDNHLDERIGHSKLSGQIQSLNDLYKDAHKFYEDYASQYIIVGNLVKLNEFSPQLSEYDNRFKALEFLSMSASQIMWGFYSIIIDDVQLLTMQEFIRQQSLLLLIMLKLQKIEIQIQIINDQESITPQLTILEDQDFNATVQSTRLLSQLNEIQSSDQLFMM